MANFIDLSFLNNPNISSINTIDDHSDHRTYFKDKENKISLNGVWKFAYFTRFNPDISLFLSSTYDIEKLGDIKVPGHYEMQGYGKPQYVNQQYPWFGKEDVASGKTPFNNPVGVYFKDLDLNGAISDRVILEIDGFNSALYLYLNGNFIGYSEKNFTPTEFDLTPYLTLGKNRIALIVFKYSKQSWFLDQDMWRFGGIFRDVYLKFVPLNHIQNIKNDSLLLDDLKSGHLDVKVNISGDLNGFSLKYSLRFNNEKLFESLNQLNHNLFVIDKIIPNIATWSAEIPNLYQLDLLLYKNDELIESSCIDIGFRNIKIVDGVFLFNGKRLKLKGVNRHEFETHVGRAITDETIKNDLLLLKANNFNAIRTSHYPNRKYFYELCDKLGFYVIDEVDLETHGTWGSVAKIAKNNRVLPGNCQEFDELVLTKDKAIFETDKNHPSIIMWSLGNESSVGSVLKKSYDFFKKHDEIRPIHYEGCYYNKKYAFLSDVDSSMYITPDAIGKRLKNQTHKPYMLCEFEHSMGNSTGNFDEYVALFDKYKNFLGGFVWDFVDQGILDSSTKATLYGGDFGDRPNDGVFSCDGLLLSDRSITSKLDTVKYYYQDLKFEKTSEGILIKNENLFRYATEYYFKLSVFEDGVLKNENKFNLQIEPEGSYLLKLPPLEIDLNKEILIRISYHLPIDREYAKKDYELGFFEYLYNSNLKKAKLNVPINQDKDVSFILNDYNLGVITYDTQYLFRGFDNFNGGLSSININGQEFLNGIIKPNLFRATTDNDENIARYFLDNYMGASKAMLSLPFAGVNRKPKINKKSAKLSYFYRYFYGSSPKKIRLDYQVREDGSVLVTMETRIGLLQHAPGEIGVTFQIPFLLNSFTYYGLGPKDNYLDRFEGEKLGIYKSDPVSEYVNYAKPQECGQHLFTRYLILESKEGNKLGIFAYDDSFAFKVLPWSALEIENASHYDELSKIKFTNITLSCATRGVGGDNSWLNPLHKQYRIKKGTKYTFRFIIKKVD